MCLHPRRFAGTFLLALALILLLMPLPASAQATSGTISGIVTDQTGASVPQATVTVRNLNTNLIRTAATASDGRFHFPGLVVGPYELTVEARGFGKYVRGPILLVLNQEAVVNTELQPASMQESIVVRADAALIETTTAEVGTRFDSRRLAELPISGQFGIGGGFRDVFASVLSAPGVSQLNSGNSAFATGTSFWPSTAVRPVRSSTLSPRPEPTDSMVRRSSITTATT